MWSDMLDGGTADTTVRSPLDAVATVRTVTAPARAGAPVAPLGYAPATLVPRPSVVAATGRATTRPVASAARMAAGAGGSLGALASGFFSPVRKAQPAQSRASSAPVSVVVDRTKAPTVLATPAVTRDAKMRRARVNATHDGTATSKDVGHGAPVLLWILAGLVAWHLLDSR